jgi:pSer/pThr/pTyr-binding forkhead associated (FHA) protein
MRRDRDHPDPNQPALVVTYGNTVKKHRPLEGEVIVLGRSSVCDINLVSPEVAPVHCVLLHGAQGWRLRDCSGRPGTRVNGKLVQETLLDDGDVIQLGAFSFQAHLPAGHSPSQPAPPPIPPSLVERLQRSRRKLIERVQKFRRLLGQRFKAIEEADARLVAERSQLSTQGEWLRARQRDYELRMMRLELSERDVATDRATLEKEYATLQEEVERHAANVRVFREEVQRREQELDEHRAALDAERENRSRETEFRSKADTALDEDEGSRVLELRARELAHFARHLRGLKSALVTSATQLETAKLMAELTEAVRGIQSAIPHEPGRNDRLAAIEP